MKLKRMVVMLLVVLQSALLVTQPGFAAGVNLTLSGSTARPGDSITASGTADPDTWVSIKALDATKNIVVFDAVKSGSDGAYTCTFKVPDVQGLLKVIAGYGPEVDEKSLEIVASPTTSPITSPTQAPVQQGQASNPTPGPTPVTLKVGENDGARIVIPYGILEGITAQDIEGKQIYSYPEIPGGDQLVSGVYEFNVRGESGYRFKGNITITLVFDPSAVAPGSNPAIYYYNEGSSRWEYIGGTVSGRDISAQVNHFTRFAVFADSKEETEPAEPLKPAAPEEPVGQDVILNDISGHWAKEYIEEMVAMGAVKGYTDGSFKPDGYITRAEFTTVLAKAFKLPAASSGKVFEDTSGYWAEEYVGAAYAAGIVTGYSDSRFGPQDPVTREQIAVMVARAGKIEAAGRDIPFKDTGEVSDWARDALAAVSQNGIISGYADGTFIPKGKATRAEAVAVIARAIMLRGS